MSECATCWGTGYIRGVGGFCPKGCKAASEHKLLRSSLSKAKKHVARLSVGGYATLPHLASFKIERLNAYELKLLRTDQSWYRTLMMNVTHAYNLVVRVRIIGGDAETVAYIPRHVSAAQQLDELFTQADKRCRGCIGTERIHRTQQPDAWREMCDIIADVWLENVHHWMEQHPKEAS